MGNLLKLILYVLVCTFVIGRLANACSSNNGSNNIEKQTYNTEDVPPALPSGGETYSDQQEASPTQPAEVSKGNFSDAEIAKYGIAAIFFQSPKIIKVKREKDIYKVSYRRPSDGTLWQNKVMIAGNQIMWGAYDGRWRDHPDDERFYFNAVGNTITISTIYSDGSTSEEQFKK